MCCSPWGHKESDKTEQLNNNRGKLQIINKDQVKTHLKHTHNKQMTKDSPAEDRNTQERGGVPALMQVFFFLIMS